MNVKKTESRLLRIKPVRKPERADMRALLAL